MLLPVSALLSVDSFIASISLTPLVPNARGRVVLALLFGAFDGLGFVVGAVFQQPVASEWIDVAGPVAIVAYALYIAFVVRQSWATSRRWSVYCLPALMSIDNLVYGGTANSAAIAPTALVLTCASALVSAAGFVLGGWIARRVEWPAFRLAALGLACTAIVMIVA